MPNSGAEIFASLDKGGLKRNPKSVVSHRMPGARDVELLKNAVTLTIEVEQLQEGYDWICRRLYSAWSIAARGVRNVRRYPLRQFRRKLFSSFSTDVGYRITYSYREG